MKILEVDLGSRSYPIYIGANLIDQTVLFSACEKATSIYIVTNTTVAPLYAERLTKTLASFGKPVRTIALPDGESYKDWKTSATCRADRVACDPRWCEAGTVPGRA